MPNILFASNNISHWPLSTSSTTADTFDATRVPYSLRTAFQESIASPTFPEVAGDVTWIHCRTYVDTIGLNDQFQMMNIFDADNNLLCKIGKFQNSPEFRLQLIAFDNGTPSATILAGFALNIGRMNSIDMRVEIGPALIDVQLYVNGGLAAVANFASNGAPYGKPNHFTLSTAFSSVGGFQYFSEILVSDADTRNARMSLLRPTAEGGETDWVGVATELADDDPTSGMTTTLANQRETLALSAYAGASNISSMVVATQTVAGVNAPQNLRHTVRMGAVNWDGPSDIPLSETLQYDITDFQINPATSLPWVSADLASLEVGFISKA